MTDFEKAKERARKLNSERPEGCKYIYIVGIRNNLVRVYERGVADFKFGEGA